MRLLALALVLLLAAPVAAQTVRAVPSQYGVNLDQEVGGTGTIVWSSATAVTNQNVRLYQAAGSCATGIGSMTVTNSSPAATWATSSLFGASRTVLNWTPPLTSIQSATLTVTLGCYAGGTGTVGTLDIQADRY